MYSPLSLRAIGGGLRALVGRDHGATERVARALEEFHGSGRALLTDSGTTALTLAMRWSIAASGRAKVALPAYCCYDIVTALRGTNAEAVFYDLDPATLGPAWDSFAAALDQRPAAVVVAHLHGLPVDMPRVVEDAESAGVTVIEDAAQGSGATLHRRPLGSFGALAVLSFGRGKGVTGGRGGALLVNTGWRGGVDDSLLLPGARGGGELVPLLAQWALARPSLYRIPASLPFLGLGDTVYKEPRPLRRISAVSAAVVEWTWRTREAAILARQRNAEALLSQAGSAGAIEAIPGAHPGWLRLPRMDQGSGKDPAASLGIIRSYPLLLPVLPVLGGARLDPSLFPGARALAQRLRTFPTHSRVSESVRSRLREEVRAAFSA